MCKIPQFNVIYILQPAECNIQLLFNNIIKNRQEHLGFPAVQGAGIFLTVRLRLLGAYFLHFSLTVSEKGKAAAAGGLCCRMPIDLRMRW